MRTWPLSKIPTEIVALVLLIVAVVGLGPVAAEAEVFGPVCFSSSSGDFFRVFIEILGGDVFQGAGVETGIAAPVTVAGFLSDSGLTISFSAAATIAFHPRYTIVEDMNLQTLIGNGLCEDVNDDLGPCGADGLFITVSLVACP